MRGRVTTVRAEGYEVRGPAFNEQGDLDRQGDPIAAMGATRYGSQVGALQARSDAARRDLQAMAAQVTLARQTLERQKARLLGSHNESRPIWRRRSNQKRHNNEDSNPSMVTRCIHDGSWLRTRNRPVDDADAAGHSNRVVDAGLCA